MLLNVRLLLRGVVLVVVVSAAGVAFCGGELPRGTTNAEAVQPQRVAPKKLGRPAGEQNMAHSRPLPAPKRRVGAGFSLHDDYGPTYYFPATYKRYGGLSPTYYPFYHPRLWPNYKSEALYRRGISCGAWVSGQQWDDYDNWVRGGRYEERQ